MLCSPMDEPRTEQPTPRKLARARRHGVVAHSATLTAATAALALLGSLLWIGPRLTHALQQLLLAGLASAAAPDASGGPLLALAMPADHAARLALCPLLAVALGAWLGGLLQVGPLFASAALTADPRRLDPAQRLRALIDPARLLDLALTACKLLALLAVLCFALAPSLRGVFALAQGDTLRAFDTVAAGATAVGLRLASAAILLGIADLVYRRLRHARQLRMGRRELTAEQRETHGSSEVRTHRNRLLQEARAQAELAAIDQASVLLLDAAGRALALAFDAADPSQRAPRIVAKAQGALGLRLQAEAARCDLPVRFAPALVAPLFRLELTEEIPPSTYDAAAELFRELRDPAP
jgi:flagellar biosynthetic protein FlhB